EGRDDARARNHGADCRRITGAGAPEPKASMENIRLRRSGQPGSLGVQVRHQEGDDKEKTHDEQLKLPPDVANGLILTLLKNIPPDAPKTTLSMVAITPKPRLVKVELTPAGEEPFATGGLHRKAMHFVAKVDIPGLAGAVASLLDKTPPDSHIWILEGDGPAFVKSESPFFPGAPLWRIELVSPTWP